MNDELLRFYNSELAYIRRLGGEFAEAYPAVAANLGIDLRGESDPFVARMIEAFAFLTARTRLRIEDDFPEVCGALLEVLYPHYQRPIPSAAVVQFAIPEDQLATAVDHSITRGRTLLTESVEGTRCEYRTAYDVHCWPLQIVEVRHEGQPLRSPKTQFSDRAAGGLCVRLAWTAPEKLTEHLPINTLRFYIQMQAPYCYEMYEDLFRRLMGVAVVEVRSGAAHTCLPKTAVQPVGFAEHESLYPTPRRSFDGYQLLTEYFAFPQKFLFFDVQLGESLKRCQTRTFDLYFYLDRHLEALDFQVQKGSLLLGCTPAVNLCQVRAEQIRLDHRKSEYPVVIDSRRPDAYEVYSIDSVSGVDPNRKQRSFTPFYSIRHAGDERELSVLWHPTRRERVTSPKSPHGGTDVALTFVDLDFDALDLNEWVVDVVTTCVNRDLPARLPFGVGRPELSFDGGDLAIPRCITAPTATRWPALGKRLRWKLLSHLSLNHLSLSATEKGAEALREILRLYDYRDSTESRQQIDGLTDVQTRPIVRRIAGPQGSVPCRGLEVALDFDINAFSDRSLFLFASVLDRFIAQYSHLNSFTQTVLRERNTVAEPHTWSPRIGTKQLL